MWAQNWTILQYVSLISVEKSLLLDPVSNFTQSYTGHFACAFYVEAQL